MVHRSEDIRSSCVQFIREVKFILEVNDKLIVAFENKLSGSMPGR